MTPATDWTEEIGADEDATHLRNAEALRALQRSNAKDGRTSRALHAKGNLAAFAEFTVLPDVPDHARAGLFAAPATYRAYVRFSNGAPASQKDSRGDVRGVAIKVLGVPGKKIIPGLEDAQTQDFLLIRTPSTPFRSSDEFVALVTAAANPLLLLPRFAARVGLGRALSILPKMAKGLGQPIASLATTRYWSALPIAFGAHAVRYDLSPRANGAPASSSRSPGYLGEELAARLAREDVVYDFRVQFYVDRAKTPIEDASVEWLEADAPFVPVARLTLPKQAIESERGRKLADFVEGLSFDPWHALVAHRPLGEMMRARNVAYRLSTEERRASREPDGTESF